MKTKEMFRYEDGSIDTPDEVLLAMNKKLRAISNPKAGKIYSIGRHRCLCLAVNASYGGGMTNCWAVEGHSAQMTFFGKTNTHNGYVKGKCLEICEDPLGIIFQPNINGEGWQNYENRSFDKRLVRLKVIGRYDINWY